MSEEIIIDGTIYNKCNGCPLYDGNICTGARLDEGTSEKDTNICNKHLAEQFWVVQRQLKLKQQECKEINLTNERLVTEKYALNEEILRFKNEINRYKQALDEIGKLIPKFDTSYGCSYGDYDCENCSDLDEDIVCTYKLKKVIKGVIDEVKE